MRWAAKRDISEKAIVDALEARGVTVWKISGKGLPDLLACFRGAWTPLEVKSTAEQRGGKKAVHTPAQINAQAEAPFPIVSSIEEALQAIGIG